MAGNVKIEKADDYLHVTYTGPFHLEAARRTVNDMVEACVREQCNRILMDCRAMTGEMSVINKFDLAQHGASTIPRSVKVALLGRPDQILPDRFFENAARNRGVTVTVFTEVDEAVAWLAE